MNKNEIRNLFDKNRIASCFKKGAATYDENAIVQKEVSGRLLNLLEKHAPKKISQVLEIGCGTGYLTGEFCSRFTVDTIFVNDLVVEFGQISTAKARSYVRVGHELPGDIEEIDLPSSLDLIISSSTFQWIEDLPSLVFRLANALKKDGLLVFAVFGPGTLGEIGTLTGRSLPYYDMEQLSKILLDRYLILEKSSKVRRLYFPSFWGILDHIKKTGVGGVPQKIRGIAELKKIAQRYLDCYATEDGLPVTYNSMYFIAKKL